jgi:hypothetical protein
MATLAATDACAGAAVNGDLFFCSYGTSSGFCKNAALSAYNDMILQ